MIKPTSFAPGRLAESYKDATGRNELTSEEIGFLIAIEQELFRVHGAIKALADDLDALKKTVVSTSIALQ